jgi:hypothetical protein
MPCPIAEIVDARALLHALANGMPFDQGAMLRAVALAGRARLIPAARAVLALEAITLDCGRLYLFSDG